MSDQAWPSRWAHCGPPTHWPRGLQWSRLGFGVLFHLTGFLGQLSPGGDGLRPRDQKGGTGTVWPLGQKIKLPSCIGVIESIITSIKKQREK